VRLVTDGWEWLRLVPLGADDPVFFGFGQYLASLALMVLAWTIADARYRFRIMTAPLPMDRISFGVVGAVGVLTLLTDLWRAAAWPVPAGPLPPAAWQATLGGAFLTTFLGWAWFAFIRPPTYGRRNAKRYAETLYRAILKGFPEQLAVASDELARSAKALVKYAPIHHPVMGPSEGKLEDVAAYSNDILLLIADKRFCRVTVASAPHTIGAFFQAMQESRKYRIAIDLFARNILIHAVANRDSFLYHESSGYDSGLLGHHKPLTTVMFANPNTIDQLGSFLDPGYFEAREWDSEQWAAYSEVVLTALRAIGESGRWWEYRSPLSSPIDLMRQAVSDLYKLDGVASPSWDDEPQARLRVVMNFIQEAAKILEEVGVPDRLQLRVRDRSGLQGTFYDRLAELMAEVVYAASAVRSPRDLSWWIQHNTVWADLTWHGEGRGSAWGVLRFKLRRLLYDEISKLERQPNFKGARILGFCLNVMGLQVRESSIHRNMEPLHKAVIGWTKRHFANLYHTHPPVGEACLVEGITYDPEGSRIVRTYPAEGLRLSPHHVYLDVHPPIQESSIGAAGRSIPS
jgi:hypothetical protein